MYTLRLASRGAGIVDRALLALLRELRPSWVIENGEVPSASRGLGLIELRLSGSERWIALLRDGEDTQSVAAALADGACAVLPIDADLDQFNSALCALIDGQAPFIPPRLARGLAQGVLAQRQPQPAKQSPTLPRLTPRETEVLGLVAAGLSNQEIARELSLSVNTVRTHLQSLAVKLHATSRAKMVASAWGSGIYPAPEPGQDRDSAAS